jgi:hypothetical protein
LASEFHTNSCDKLEKKSNAAGTVQQLQKMRNRRESTGAFEPPISSLSSGSDANQSAVQKKHKADCDASGSAKSNKTGFLPDPVMRDTPFFELVPNSKRPQLIR